MGYYLKCSYDNSLSCYHSYRGPSPAEWLIREFQDLAENVESALDCAIPMEILTLEQERAFEKATICHICEESLGDKRVRDHCHLSGR